MQALQLGRQRGLGGVGRHVVAHAHGDALQALAAQQPRGGRGVRHVDRGRCAAGKGIRTHHTDHLHRHAAQQHRAADRVTGEQCLRSLLVDHAHGAMRVHFVSGEEAPGLQPQPAHARQIRAYAQHLGIGATAALQRRHRSAQVGADTVHRGSPKSAPG
ncbi:hypothetical protein G6F50_014136 [Rhizopus delemar]|uniref:Uncharacterized protein n=1 Tax=Rhizopus delemar TaxID=936053 RepID=A0A9P6Y992_9FUNG|nr:hypothetical protein G6F50_014136 [Rhizopus delemar]